MSIDSKLSLIIADNNIYFRQGLQIALSEYQQIEFIADTGSGMHLCELVERYKPHVVIIDTLLSDKNYIEIIRYLREKFIHIGIIAMVMNEDVEECRDILIAGANACLKKNAELSEINAAIFSARLGSCYVSNHSSKNLDTILKYSTDSNTLSKREREIIQLLFNELTSTEISDQLCISKRTVEEHRKMIQRKTGAKNVVGVMKYALRKKYVKLS